MFLNISTAYCVVLVISMFLQLDFQLANVNILWSLYMAQNYFKHNTNRCQYFSVIQLFLQQKLHGWKHVT